MKKALCLLLAVCVFVSALPLGASAESFTLRNGILFGDSCDTVKSKETLAFSATDDKILDSGDHQVFTVPGRVAGIDDITVMFRFNTADQLYTMKYSKMFMDSKDDLDHAYTTIHDGLVRKYGEPLGNTGGKLYGITTNAIESAALILALYGKMNVPADYLDYDEWVVDLDGGEHVKIDMMGYYTGKTGDRKYHIAVGYLLFTDADVAAKIADKKASNDAIDSDL